MPATRHVFQIFIRAEQDAVWRAIVDPAFTRRYFHATAFETTLEPGSPYRYVLPDGEVAVEGTVEEVERRVGSSRRGACSTTRRWPPSRPAGSSGTWSGRARG